MVHIFGSGFGSFFQHPSYIERAFSQIKKILTPTICKASTLVTIILIFFLFHYETAQFAPPTLSLINTSGDLVSYTQLTYSNSLFYIWWTLPSNYIFYKTGDSIIHKMGSCFTFFNQHVDTDTRFCFNCYLISKYFHFWSYLYCRSSVEWNFKWDLKITEHNCLFIVLYKLTLLPVPMNRFLLTVRAHSRCLVCLQGIFKKQIIIGFMFTVK